MKILLVSTQDYIHHPLPSRHHHIFEELAARGHEIYVPHFHVSDGEARQTKLHVVEATRFPIKDPFAHYVLNAPTHFSVFDDIIYNEEIDVVVASHILAGYAAIKIAKKYGVPVVYDMKDWYPTSAEVYYSNPLMKYVLRKGVWAILKRNLQQSDVITTVSPSLAKRLYQHKFYKAQVIPNGADTNIFKPMATAEARKLVGNTFIRPNDFVIGFVGAIEKWFDFKCLVDALAQIVGKRPNAKLLIVGDVLFTNQLAELRQYIRHAGLEDNVIFTGRIAYDRLPAYINSMDICTIPMGTAMAEIALPNKYFEYAACGKPIMSTPIPDLIKVANGGLYFYSDAEEFAEIALSLEPADFTCAVSNNGYGWSWAARADEFERLLKRCS